MGSAAFAIRYRAAYEPEDARITARYQMAKRIVESAIGADGLDIATDETIEKAYALADALIVDRSMQFHGGDARVAKVALRKALREEAEAKEHFIRLKANFDDGNRRGHLVIDEKPRMAAAEARMMAAAVALDAARKAAGERFA